jgi:hypothetical protein
MRQLSIARYVLHSVALFSALTGQTNARFLSVATISSASTPTSSPAPTVTCSPHPNGELKRRDGPVLNLIPGYNNLQVCASNCVYWLTNEVAGAPAAQCNNHECVCQNQPAGDQYLSLCFTNHCDNDATELPSIISIFSVWCSTGSSADAGRTTSNAPAATQSASGNGNSGNSNSNSNSNINTNTINISHGAARKTGIKVQHSLIALSGAFLAWWFFYS